MREFAEQEIKLPPGGPYGGHMFRVDRQPFTGLFFDLCEALDDRGRPMWRHRCLTGPTQDGKTLVGMVIPTVYHLFELKESVILGAPTMPMCHDKWERDIKPIIAASRYAELLPQAGKGSRGGKPDSIVFRNGVHLKFMSAGGGDEQRSGYTARVVVMTEIDKMDEAGEASREADPVSQMEARTDSWGDLAVFYKECTASIELGRIWQEITGGSDSRIVVPCNQCGAYVTLEREHLVGWQDAENEVDAEAGTHYCCPGCGVFWTEEDRREANAACRVIHRGQEIDSEGMIHGPVPPTRTLGFRWNVGNSNLKSAGQVGVEEWKSQRNEHGDNSERAMCQFRWAVPYKGDQLEGLTLSVQGIMSRFRPELSRGIVPADADWLGVGVDLNKFKLSWVCICLDAHQRPHVVDYGVHATEAAMLGTDKALAIALMELRDRFEQGWATEDGDTFTPDQVFIDARWKTKEVVYPFVRHKNVPSYYMPAMGYGAGQMRHQGDMKLSYTAPARMNKQVREIGRGYHRVYYRPHKVQVMHVDANKWKMEVHEGLAIPLRDELERPILPLPDRAMTLPAPSRPNEHLDYAKHATAERYQVDFVEGKGHTGGFITVRKENHLLDGSMLAMAAATRAREMPKKQNKDDYFEKQRNARRA